MTADPTAEALAQLRLRYRMAVSSAELYRRAGFTTILQDIVIGPMLGELVAMVDHRPFSLVVLAPQVDEVVRREQQRAKTGYGAVTPWQLDAVLRDETPRLGYWLDSTGLTVDETVDRVVAELDGAARLD
jgi:hypothetical protein